MLLDALKNATSVEQFNLILAALDMARISELKDAQFAIDENWRETQKKHEAKAKEYEDLRNQLLKFSSIT